MIRDLLKNIAICLGIAGIIYLLSGALFAEGETRLELIKLVFVCGIAGCFLFATWEQHNILLPQRLRVLACGLMVYMFTIERLPWLENSHGLLKAVSALSMLGLVIYGIVHFFRLRKSIADINEKIRQKNELEEKQDD